jgi:small-conductance mechanosensitive channel
VAYGSDTAKVKDVLLGVAQAHPLVLFDFEGVSDPSVIFRRFGDSSLDFELRCVIRDVDKRLSVLSDLNFAVDKAFRERGIEIPFPQREVHVRDLRTRDSETSDNLGGPGEA